MKHLNQLMAAIARIGYGSNSFSIFEDTVTKSPQQYKSMPRTKKRKTGWRSPKPSTLFSLRRASMNMFKYASKYTRAIISPEARDDLNKQRYEIAAIRAARWLKWHGDFNGAPRHIIEKAQLVGFLR